MEVKEMLQEIEVRLARLGIKKGEFYKLADISSASYSQWNTGRSIPSAEAIARINSVLGTSFELSKNTDSIYEKIQMLQNLRDADKYLLDVASDMTEEQVRKVADFMKAMKADAD